FLARPEKRAGRVAVALAGEPDLFASRLCLAAVPQDRLGERARAAVVEEGGAGLDELDEADPPQRRGAPLDALGGEVAARVGEQVADVVQQEVGVGVDRLMRELRGGGVAADQ